MVSGRLGHDENAHEKHHDEEDPHEEPVHYLGNFLPLCSFGLVRPLLAEAVCDIVDVAHHFLMLATQTRALTSDMSFHIVFHGVGFDITVVVAVATGVAVAVFVSVYIEFFRNGEVALFQLLLALVQGVQGVYSIPIPANVVCVFGPLWFLSGKLWLCPRMGSMWAATLVPVSMVVADMATISATVVVPVVLMMEPITLSNVTIETTVKVAVSLQAGQRVLREDRAMLAFRGSAVLPHLIHKEDLGHVVDDQDFGPVGDRFGLSTTKMNVHDEDRQRRGGCDHRHCRDVVLTYNRRKEDVY